jgi:hypothetical protein
MKLREREKRSIEPGVAYLYSDRGGKWVGSGPTDDARGVGGERGAAIAVDQGKDSDLGECRRGRRGRPAASAGPNSDVIATKLMIIFS